MKRSRSRSPLNHPPHSKHNWNANAHKWHAGAVAEEECSSDSRNSSRNSHRRSQGDSNCINIPSSHNTERRRRSGSCDTGDHRPRRSGSFDTSEHRLRRISNRWKWEDRKEELRRIRVVIKRNTVHEPDNSPIDRSVNVEEVVIPRHPGMSSLKLSQESSEEYSSKSLTLGRTFFNEMNSPLSWAIPISLIYSLFWRVNQTKKLTADAKTNANKTISKCDKYQLNVKF
ncbi:unnamed protein product [Bemisia tabaci]|uniref:Uncharacterized protein n=1 Tax=Bemisia tabaci TaxID=7038 RepID=A0A9P0F1H2_BEMTA|nr:unnamed protein product [Bemisia tabaci]